MNWQIAAQEVLEKRDALVFACEHWQEQMAILAKRPEETLDRARRNVRGVGGTLPISRAVLWTHDMFELSQRGAGRAFKGRAIPEFDETAQPEWWTFRGFKLPLGGSDEEKVEDARREGLPVDAVLTDLLIIPDQTRLIVVTLHCTPGDTRPRIRVNEVRTGQTFSDGLDVTITACREFMNSTVAAREPLALPRAARRRIRREHKELPDIRIVALRRAESAERESKATRVYRYQHIVSGHWRHLNEPRKSDGANYTFVHAHVKGPKGAPLLKPRESIHVVSR